MALSEGLLSILDGLGVTKLFKTINDSVDNSVNPVHVSAFIDKTANPNVLESVTTDKPLPSRMMFLDSSDTGEFVPVSNEEYPFPVAVAGGATAANQTTTNTKLDSVIDSLNVPKLTPKDFETSGGTRIFPATKVAPRQMYFDTGDFGVDTIMYLYNETTCTVLYKRGDPFYTITQIDGYILEYSSNLPDFVTTDVVSIKLDSGFNYADSASNSLLLIQGTLSSGELQAEPKLNKQKRHIELDAYKRVLYEGLVDRFYGYSNPNWRICKYVYATNNPWDTVPTDSSYANDGAYISRWNLRATYDYRIGAA